MLVLELMVKGHVMDEVTLVQLLPQQDGISTSYREGDREHLGRATGSVWGGEQGAFGEGTGSIWGEGQGEGDREEDRESLERRSAAEDKLP